MQIRPRRLRKDQFTRDLVAENKLCADDFIYPVFIQEGTAATEINAMPGIKRHCIDSLLKECEEILQLGIKSIAIFPVIGKELKDLEAKESYNSQGLTQRTVRDIKKRFPELLITTDIALDPYTVHGHDGLLGLPQNPSKRKTFDEIGKGEDRNYTEAEILNDATVNALCQMALVQAQAGADIVAPSDMMDGRVSAIRRTLDQNGFQDVLIMSYTAKYASCFYAPFRDALGSLKEKETQSNDEKIHPELPRLAIPKNKLSYQMNPANSREAIKELQLDLSEGADILMVKPASFYLDIISKYKNSCSNPVAAYQVSGEYSMIHAAAEKGYLELDRAVWESLISIKRAGADIILSYFAKDYLAK